MAATAAAALALGGLTGGAGLGLGATKAAKSTTLTVGQACTTDAQCPRNGACLTAAIGFPGGYCVTPECEASQFACAAGATCIPATDTGGLCVKSCTVV